MFSNAGDLPPATNEEERRTIVQTASKLTSGLNNPCIQEQKLSYKCLSENNYDKDKCEYAFKNYSMCQQFWSKVQAHRRAKGIRPYLPRPEEREKIKEEYMKELNMKFSNKSGT